MPASPSAVLSCMCRPLLLHACMHASYVLCTGSCSKWQGDWLTHSNVGCQTGACIASVQTWGCKMMHGPQPCNFDKQSSAMVKVEYQHVGGSCIADIL